MPLLSFPDPPEPASDVVHLWWGRVGAGPPSLEGLAPDERDRVARFHDPRHARRFAGRRAFLRALLGRIVGVPATDLAFLLGEHRKPSLPEGPRFNLSHSGDHVLVAVTRDREVGVDVQVHRLRTDRDRLAARVLCPAELRAFEAASEEERELAFFRLWARKEAALKATGHGLARDPRLLEVGLDRQELGRPWPAPDALLEGYLLADLEVPSADPALSACLCVEGEGWEPRAQGSAVAL